jgi:chromosome transmission fidelity protein 1
MDEAGRLLAHLASLVPQGLVAFAPSFAYCEQLLERWGTTGLLQQLSAKKRFFRYVCGGVGG